MSRPDAYTVSVKSVIAPADPDPAVAVTVEVALTPRPTEHGVGDYATVDRMIAAGLTETLHNTSIPATDANPSNQVGG
jgi:hypothetical protein